MANINYPTVTKPEYSGFISELRTGLTRVAEYVDQSPGAAADVKAQVIALMNRYGWTNP